ncbi:sensor histidine kinase [Sulfurospirillum barnesii]|uniref:histidine kinase n=1 Tax=Sulfurospirillum barnesii (strain ATCC 700032 / DSM 10660 / SES-3) TaxID=760154 RepID=I3XZK7_SULBS|nr:HAMP domain-containing sensor histidine kinase [Sulfurospirillum barnesii]AFL69381.1 signal transduction histidine kinase [Sulfurospirillum barnesii SES-3]
MNDKNSLDTLSDAMLLEEVKRRFDQKNQTLEEMVFLTKKLYDLNEKLKEHDSIKGEFLSLIKNVFNNPLSSLLNLSSMMQKNQDSPKTQTLKELMDTELRKLDFQLNNIFTAAEIEAGEIANYWSEVNLEQLLAEVCEGFSALVVDKALSWDISCQEGMKVVSDAKKLHTILANLLSNACEYSFRGNTIRIRIETQDEFFTIAISNRGDVIEKGFKQELFSRFKKLSKRTKAREGVDGLGLGLSIVKALVESLDGEVDYCSSKEVTTFTLKLALQDKSKAEALMSESANEFMFDDAVMKEF